MSANSTDLRHISAEVLGETVITAMSNSSARTAELVPGRYCARVRTVSTAATLWLRQGNSAVSAAAAAPSTPFEVSGTVVTAVSVRALNEVLFTFIVRGGEANDGHLAGITNAGTLDLVITKVSRYKN